MLAAHRWLEDRLGDGRPFFLWIDTFDPHEPWDAPRYYVDAYDPLFTGDALLEPAYEPSGYATDAEIAHMRCLYAAKLTLVDRWIGVLLEGLERMGLADDTLVIFTSDHGFYHGEHGLIGKVHLDRANRIIGRWPLYETITHAPLLIRHPGAADRGPVRNGFCQPPDLTATILDAFGLPAAAPLQGASLLPRVADGAAPPARDVAVSSLTFVQDDSVRSPSSLRTTDWLYVYGGDEWDSELYDLRADPQEIRNVIDSHEDTARDLHERYIAFLGQLGCSDKSLRLRRDFRPTRRGELPPTRTL
jgi:arylsulfatase A-like enzyme